MPSDVFKLTSRTARIVTPTRQAPARQAAVARSQSRMPNDECRDILDQVLRQTVISRLRLAHPDTLLSARVAKPNKRIAINPDYVDGFVQVLRFEDQAEVDQCVEWLIDEGFGIEGVLLDVVPGAEILLVALAAAESGDHADITLGQWRLAELVERLGARFQAAATVARHEHRALLTTTEPHGSRLRLQIAAESLNHDGWSVWSDADSPLTELAEVLHCDWFALVLIASEQATVEALAGTIHALRRASVNAQLRVLVLSAALVRRPDRLVRVGADAAAGDIRQLAVQAERLLLLMPPNF